MQVWENSNYVSYVDFLVFAAHAERESHLDFKVLLRTNRRMIRYAF